jgi:predicted O-methyltransferase YrrM
MTTLQFPLPKNFDFLDHTTPVVDLLEISRLAETARIVDPGHRVIVEIGSWVGLSACAILNAVGSDDRLYCIDHWLGNPNDRIGEVAKKHGQEKAFKTFCSNLRQDLMDRAVPLVGTSRLWASVWRRPISMVYIDGNHDCCGEDAELWLPHIAYGGILAGHDYGLFENVSDTVDRLRKKGRDVNVVSGGSVWHMVVGDA